MSDNEVCLIKEVNMLRIKSKKISVQFITLAVLCLCYGLMLYLSLPPAYAGRPPLPPYYIVDVYQTPGIVYRIENEKSSIFFRRRSGSISSIALWGDKLLFCSDNDRRIYQKIGEQERVVFEHRTYIRDVAVDPSGYLYISEANGAKGDGRIYKLSPHIDKLGREGRFSISSDSQGRPIQVRLITVDKYWDGYFTFDLQGNIYLSTGYRIPAFIYRVPRQEGSTYGSPQKQYSDTKGAIKGIAIDPRNPNFIYYADWNKTIFRLNIRDSRRSIAFSGSLARSRNPHLSDVAFDFRIRR